MYKIKDYNFFNSSELNEHRVLHSCAICVLDRWRSFRLLCAFIGLFFAFCFVNRTDGCEEDESACEIFQSNESNDTGIPDPAQDSQNGNIDFDVDLVEQYVDYLFLVEDGIDFVDSNKEAFELLDKGEYGKAIESMKKVIEDSLNEESQHQKAPWKVETPTKWKFDSGDPTMYMGYPLAKNLQLLGLAYELNGDFYEANKAYEVVYGANEKAMSWTEARLLYEKNQREFAFARVSDILHRYYRLTPQKIDDVIARVRATESKWKASQNVEFKPAKPLPARVEKTLKEIGVSWTTNQKIEHKPIGVPVELDVRNYRDIEAVELYRIRDWCARFACPNLVYKNRTFTSDNTGKERVESVRLIRDSYAQFMEFMEQTYEEAMSEGLEGARSFRLRDRNKSAKEAFTESIEILRKLKELPY